MPDDTTDAVVRLGRVALDFGRVDRITFHPNGTTPESDTDHTVMLGLIACALARKWYPALDVGMVAQHALVHDLAEVYAGDHPTLKPQSDADKARKRHGEAAALVRLSRDFRTELPWVSGSIVAYEWQTAPEARLVKFVDKLMPKITHLLNGAATISQQGMTRRQLVDRYELQGRELALYADEFPEVEQLRLHLVEQVLARIDEEPALDAMLADYERRVDDEQAKDAAFPDDEVNGRRR